LSTNDRPGGQAQSSPRQSAAWIDADAGAGDVRVGDSTVVKGGSKIVFAEDSQAVDQPAQGRSLSEEEIAESGLLRERVIEIGERREEAVVSKQAFVREELVVRRDVEERIERIAGTLRSTEVDVERLAPEAVEGEGAGDSPGR